MNPETGFLAIFVFDIPPAYRIISGWVNFLKIRIPQTKEQIIQRRSLVFENSGLLTGLLLLLELGGFCRLLINFADGLDSDQDRWNVGTDLDPNGLALCSCFLKDFFKKLILKKSQQTTTEILASHCLKQGKGL